MSIFKRKKEANNRRKHIRVNNRNLVAIDHPERKVFNLIDISETGLQFSSSQPFESKEVLNLTVNLAEADIQFRALSRVAWTREIIYKKTKVYRVGLTFIELSQQARQIIRQLSHPIAKAA